ncbi:MAG: hypothetical protein ACIAQF_10910 [Phycisphaerales bacterium JB065]
MTLATRSRSLWMTQRRCVGCGLRAATTHDDTDRQETCPRCGIDWAERPPQSYAELEGFDIETEPALARPIGARNRHTSRRTQVLRTIEITLFLLMVVMVLVVASANIVAALRGGLG